MSMSAAINNFISWRERQQHERLENTVDEEAPPADLTLTPDEETPADADDNSVPAVEPIVESDVETADQTETEPAESSSSEEGGATAEEGDLEEDVRRARRTVSLVELEEERELTRRRTSACVLLAVFVLFRLWIQAIVNVDFGMLLLCLVGTSWTARWIRHNQEREEELDRRIAAYWNSDPEGAVTEMPRSDLRMLSFQAQLALAIMESQRQMMQGGHGHPDGEANANQGVSDEAKQRWVQYEHKTNGLSPEKAKGSYGSVSQEEKLAAGQDEDLAHCSICLCEYEDGDSVVRLPCSHVYHDECVSSWTSSHVRCPLCNFDLESVTDSATPSVSSLPAESMV